MNKQKFSEWKPSRNMKITLKGQLKHPLSANVIPFVQIKTLALRCFNRRVRI